MNMYAPFSENSVDTWGVQINNNERRLTRNFEELVTERGDDNFGIIFDKIKEKLFISSQSDDADLTVQDFLKFNEKYNTDEVRTSIKVLKENISNFYIKKLEHSILIQERRRLFESFCNNIVESVKMIDEITKVSSPEDTQLKILLSERIDMYYKQLDIDNLVNTECSLDLEFTFLKQTIIELCSINPTICTICMENQVSWFVDPCGHTLCGSCKDKSSKLTNCHYCRTTKLKYNKLFL